MTHRPVDSTGLAERAFGMTRPEAHRLGLCVRCKRDVSPAHLTDVDAKEYEFSAICPKCWGEIFPPEEACE